MNGTAERANCHGRPRIRLKRYRWVYPSGTIIDGYQSCSAVPLSIGFNPMGASQPGWNFSVSKLLKKFEYVFGTKPNQIVEDRPIVGKLSEPTGHPLDVIREKSRLVQSIPKEF